MFRKSPFLFICLFHFQLTFSNVNFFQFEYKIDAESASVVMVEIKRNKKTLFLQCKDARSTSALIFLTEVCKIKKIAIVDVEVKFLIIW